MPPRNIAILAGIAFLAALSILLLWLRGEPAAHAPPPSAPAEPAPITRTVPVPATQAPPAPPVARPPARPVPDPIPALLDALQAAVEEKRWDDAAAGLASLAGRNLDASQEERRTRWSRRLTLRKAFAEGRFSLPVDINLRGIRHPLTPIQSNSFRTLKAGQEHRTPPQAGEVRYFSVTQMRSEDLAALLDQMEELGHDALSLPSAGPAEWALLERHPGIRRLHLQNCPQPVAATLPALARLRSLALEERRGSTVESLLRAATGLEELALKLTGNGEQPVPSGWIAALAGLPRLQHLALEDCALPRDLSPLRGARNLVSLHGRQATALAEALPGLKRLHGVDWSPALAAALAAQAGSLEELALSRTGSEDLSVLAQLGLLRRLSLGLVRPQPQDFGCLARISRLEELELRLSFPPETGSGDAATLGRLGAISSLRCLRLSGSGIDDAMLSACATIPSLRELDLSQLDRCGPAGLSALAAGRGLERLSLAHMKGVDGTALKHLIQKPGLRHLVLAYCTVTGDQVRALSSCGDLETLDLRHNPVLLSELQEAAGRWPRRPAQLLASEGKVRRGAPAVKAP